MSLQSELQAILDALAGITGVTAQLVETLELDSSGHVVVPDGNLALLDVTDVVPNVDSTDWYAELVITVACLSPDGIAAAFAVANSVVTAMDALELQVDGQPTLIGPDVGYPHRGVALPFKLPAAFDTFA